MNRHTYIIEAPDGTSERPITIDLVDVAVVTLGTEKRNGRRVLVVSVRQDKGDGYTWDEHERTIPLPVRKVRP